MNLSKQIVVTVVIVSLAGMAVPVFSVPSKPVPSEPEQRHKDYYYAYRMYQDSLFDLAAEEFVSFVDNNPGNANCSEALFLAGESLFRIWEFDKARAVYLRCAIEYPLESRVVPALSQAAA